MAMMLGCQENNQKRPLVGFVENKKYFFKSNLKIALSCQYVVFFQSNPRTGVICKQGIPDSEDERHFQNISGGGGGGGGGTYVFMVRIIAPIILFYLSRWLLTLCLFNKWS